jgi:Universal stress protein family
VEAAQQQLVAIRPTVPSVQFKTLLEKGDAAERILDAAKTDQSDLIVMGTHGRTGLGRLLMGSVAEQVLRGATCAVLTVKTPLSEAVLSEVPRQTNVTGRSKVRALSGAAMKAGNPRNRFDLATCDGVTELEELVRDSVGGRLREFRLVVADSGLILQGRAPTYYGKQLAQHAVMQATCLPILANEIEVQ